MNENEKAIEATLHAALRDADLAYDDAIEAAQHAYNADSEKAYADRLAARKAAWNVADRARAALAALSGVPSKEEKP
jgi:hypothetical protein